MKENGVGRRVSSGKYRVKYHKTKGWATMEVMASVSVEKALRKIRFTNIDLETDTDFLIVLPS